MTNTELPKANNAVENANGRKGNHPKAVTVAMLERYKYLRFIIQPQTNPNRADK